MSTHDGDPAASLTIWHVGTGVEHRGIDGLSQAVWAMATEQARLGHQVTLWCREDPGPDDIAEADRRGLDLSYFDPRAQVSHAAIVERLGHQTPDIVHLHGAWVPAHPMLAARLRRRGIPYVVQPHGAHTRSLLDRRAVLRRAWLRFIERPMIRGAAGVIYLHRSEAAEGRHVVGPHPAVHLAPYGSMVQADRPRWDPSALDARRVVYLGRYDVYQKGLDDLVALAEATPDITFELHGTRPATPRPAEEFDRLAARAPANVHFDEPVFDTEKSERLVNASAYIQFARFEGFPLAISEALAHGVPVACPNRLGCTQELAEADACVALDDDPAIAATQLQRALDDPDRLVTIAANGSAWFDEHLAPDVWTRRHLDIYRQVLGLVPT